MDIKKITANRGLSVILLVLVVIASMVLVNLLITNRNFDNETLASRRYSGSLTIQTQPIITMDVYFDGFGLINATMNYSNNTLSYEGEYICIGEEVQFYVVTEENYQFTFLGNILEENTIITGNVELKKSATEIFNGTFYLSLI